MNIDEILAQLPDDALLLEPREYFDSALVGITTKPTDHWPRTSSQAVAVYDRDLCIEAIMRWLECDEDGAVEWYEYNTVGAWLGDGTPTFRSVCNEGYLAGVEECPDCGERFCAVCEQHWADCPCPGPHDNTAK